jgi:putative ABC transport system permease protein
MILNYFKIAIRNVVSNKIYSGLNIGGLALGIASSMLIFLWVQDELNIGTQYKNASSLYRIMEREFTDGKIVADEDTPGLLADELKREFPEIKYAAALSSPEFHMLAANKKAVRYGGNYVGADWFNIYSIPLLSGSTSALISPGNVAISKKLALQFFGQSQLAMGKSIRFDNNKDYQVTAVFEDLSDHEQDQYEYLLNWTDYLNKEPWLKEWSNYGPSTRIQLHETLGGKPVDPAALNAKLTWFLKGRDTDFGATYHTNLFLVAEKDAYLYSNYKNGYQDGGRIEYVRLLSIVAVFLLLIAGINFMNLSTARSFKRAVEVGVRKAVGAGRESLIFQFMSEAFLMTLMAFTLALLAVIFVIPAFNDLTGKQLAIPYHDVTFWLKTIALLVVTALISGSYPALLLSGFSPVKVLKGVLKTSGGSLFFRRGLVVFQFMLSMMMIVGTFIIYRQLQFFQNKNLGFDRENLIGVPIDGALSKNYAAFKQELLQTSGIQSVTSMATNPLANSNTTESVSWIDKNPDATISFHNSAVGIDYAKTMKLEFVSGRDFNPGFASDSSNYLINETAAKRIGYKDPVGQPLTFWGRPGKIIGVIKDFHFNSLHTPITPMIIRLAEANYGSVLIKTGQGQTKAALENIESLYKKLNPGFEFSYYFLDQDYEKLYRSENIVGKLATIFACLAIFIACLGLFGLATFTAEQRRKEIGVRKVLGASIASIIALISTGFLKLVLIAILIASPITWYITDQWLQHFAYRIDVEWWVFAVAGLASTGIAIITISFQSIKAATVNPVKSLKSE